MDIEKVLTDCPMLDEIIYNCKQMLYDGVVLKDDIEADNNETDSSLVRSDLYLASIDGLSIFEMYKFGEIELSVIPNITSKEIYEWTGDNTLIPQEYRDMLLENIKVAYVKSYEEENEYYRKYNGLPPLDDEGVTVPEELVPDSLYSFWVENKPVHLYSDNIIEAFESSGVLDELIDLYPDYTYLKYIGKRKISIYDARKAEKFAPLYVPECDNEELRSRFQELLEINRTIYLRYYYDEAYNYKSDYYEKFMMVMIILQTVCDMINEIPEYLIRKDVFDVRTVQYLFEASGVEFFPEIPLRYQISLVRNLNKLIKYKSTDKCIVDIVSLFGFDNIEVFKYYLMKSRKRDSDGNYIFATTTNEEGEETEDLDACYSLQFLKVGIDELPDDAARTDANILDYEELTRDDDYWRGDHTEDEVRQDILAYNFNMLRTKYMSIKSVYNMSSYLFQVTYFINLLLNNNIDKSLVMFNVPTLDMSMTIMDAFIYMYALAHVYYGTEDVIVTDVEDSLKILGFNFEADLSELATYLWEKGVKTFEDMGISGWQAPTNGIFTFNQLMNVYTTNKDIYDHVVHEMVTANNAKIYRLYKKIYDSLMLTKINLEYFTIDDEGTVATSFAEYLQYKKSDLYLKYLAVIQESDETRNDTIANQLYNIACCIEEKIDIGIVPYIFAGLPAASIESVKTYVMDMINFFKSFKVTILDLNTIYVFDDRLTNTCLIIDDAIIKCFFNPKEQVLPNKDRISSLSTTRIEVHRSEITDRWYKAYRQYHTGKSDCGIIKDTISRKASTRLSDSYTITDKVPQIAYVYDQSDIVGITKERARKKNTMHITESSGISNENVSIRYV
jgi:hypothetical protein